MFNREDFEKLVERRIDFLITDTIFRMWGNEKGYLECAGFAELAAKQAAYIDFNYYCSRVDVNRVKNLALKRGVATFANNFCKNGEKHGEEALQYSRFVKAQDCSKKSTAELFEMLEKFDEKALRAIAFTWPTHPVALAVEEELRRAIGQKIKQQVEVDGFLAVLTFPTRENTPLIESRELMQIALEISKLSVVPMSLSQIPCQLKTKLVRHIEKFGFLGARGAGLKCWNVEDVFKRVAELCRDPLLAEKIEKSRSESKHNLQETEKIMNGLDFSQAEKELVAAAKEIVYFRTYRTEVLYHIYSDIENLLGEIGKRFNYSLSEMQFLATEEILKLDKAKPNKYLINDRQTGFVVLLENGKLDTFVGEKRKEIERAFEEKVTATELKGTIACRGKITGCAKVVLTANNLDKVKQGDILVTVMTTPDFVPAMQRAAAFVTNEGGITCHAAIVARELNKPCIIGTKVATKVFQDGDVVEVDANKGTVKILKKSTNR